MTLLNATTFQANTDGTNPIVDGTTVLTTNTTASGKGFSTVSPGSGGSITYSDDLATNLPHIVGPRSVKFVAAAATTCYLNRGLSNSQISQRLYFYLTGGFTAATQFARIYDSTTWCANCGINGTTMTLRDFAGTTVYTFTTLPLNTWLRLRSAVIVGSTTSNGSLAADLIRCDTGASLGSYTAAGTANTGTSTIASLAIGKISATGNSPTFYIKGHAYDSTLGIGLIPDDASWEPVVGMAA